VQKNRITPVKYLRQLKGLIIVANVWNKYMLRSNYHRDGQEPFWWSVTMTGSIKNDWGSRISQQHATDRIDIWAYSMIRLLMTPGRTPSLRAAVWISTSLQALLGESCPAMFVVLTSLSSCMFSALKAEKGKVKFLDSRSMI
jgi:hypothetical protein